MARLIERFDFFDDAQQLFAVHFLDPQVFQVFFFKVEERFAINLEGG